MHNAVALIFFVALALAIGACSTDKPCRSIRGALWRAALRMAGSRHVPLVLKVRLMAWRS